MIASCASRKSSRAARSRIAKSAQPVFHRETVEGCTPTRAAAALSETPVSRIAAQSASSTRSFSPLGRPICPGLAEEAVGDPERVEGAEGPESVEGAEGPEPVERVDRAEGPEL